MRITRTVLALAVAALSATACSDSNAPAASHVGRYGLMSVNGDPVPVTLLDDPTLTLVLTQGALTLNANSTFTQEATFAVTTNGFPAAPMQLSCDGTYTRSGNSFTLTGNETAQCGGTTATGVLSGSTFTVSDDQGETLVFRR